MTSVKMVIVVLMITLFGLLPLSQLAHAEIYKWVDEKGTVHFTEDPETIPEEYRDRAKSRTTEEDLMTPEERAIQRKSYEEEVRERLKREKKEYDLREIEKRVKEMEDRAKKERQERAKEMEDQARKERERGRCEIVGYSQYDVVKDIYGGGVHGHVIPGTNIVSGDYDVSASKQTCVDITIQNNAQEAKRIQNHNIVAYTRKGNRETPQEGVLIQLAPGQVYRGNICFGKRLSTIVKMELQGL
jgi:hypothetical protein